MAFRFDYYEMFLSIDSSVHLHPADLDVCTMNAYICDDTLGQKEAAVLCRTAGKSSWYILLLFSYCWT